MGGGGCGVGVYTGVYRSMRVIGCLDVKVIQTIGLCSGTSGG